MAKKPRFNLKNHQDDETLIVMVFRIAGHKITISTGFSIPPKYWDVRNGRVKETKAFRLHTKINAGLNRMEAATVDLWHEYRQKGITPNPDKFKAALVAKLETNQAKEPGLIPFIRQFIEERQIVSPVGTIQVYERTLRHLENYAAARRKVLDFDDITEAFKADWVAYMQGQGLADITTNKMLATLRAFLKSAYKRGLIETDVTTKTQLSIPTKESEAVYLTEAELEKLWNLPDLGERLENIRDLFLLGCLTGLRYSDYSTIQPENIRDIEHQEKVVSCLVVQTKKTAQRVVVPLTNPMLLAILEKRKMKAPKPVTNQVLNRYLKELCQLARFDTPIEVTEVRAGRQQKTVYPKWQLISSHTARRTFCTIAYKRGMPIPDIMRFSGHKTPQSFLKYVRTTAEETAVTLSEHPFFTKKSPLKKVQ